MGIAITSLEYDLAIIGAGPVGLALAIESARLGFTTLVLDRRPPLAEDASVRPQLLVARAGDLAHLARLGIDLEDPRVVSRLHTRCEGDLASGRIVRGEIVTTRGVPELPSDLWALASQPPYALVPIGRLQQALLARVLAHGATVAYGCEVTRLRRHARNVSLTCADGTSYRAAMAVIATGAARPLIETILKNARPTEGVTRRLIGGLFAIGGKRGQWTRVELAVRGFDEPVRTTVLQTPGESGAGTALLVDPRIAGTPSLDRLHQGFATAAQAHGLAGAPYIVPPQVFATAATTLPHRFIGGDGRAPIVIAGDAAQTGHVFSGQTCFVNVALALGLANELRTARTAIIDRSVNAPELLHALRRYDAQSAIGAAILDRNSQRHVASFKAGAWALAGVARA
ncbi:MAG: FAD-dependent monooxygenase [Deltaproteobacteria bacterium]|nr:FAD-dependent monooxygenase [Deltaproteobacteria bacterium]